MHLTDHAFGHPHDLNRVIGQIPIIIGSRSLIDAAANGIEPFVVTARKRHSYVSFCILKITRTARNAVGDTGRSVATSSMATVTAWVSNLS